MQKARGSEVRHDRRSTPRMMSCNIEHDISSLIACYSGTVLTCRPTNKADPTACEHTCAAQPQSPSHFCFGSQPIPSNNSHIQGRCGLDCLLCPIFHALASPGSCQVCLLLSRALMHHEARAKRTLTGQLCDQCDDVFTLDF